MKQSWKQIGWLLACLGVGLLAGVLIPQAGLRGAFEELVAELLAQSTSFGKMGAAHDDHDDHHDDHGLVELSKEAQLSLGLRRQAIVPTSFTATLSLPAHVVELPGVSDLHVVTEFEGVIEEIFVVPGQAVRVGDPLFRIRLTGDQLASAQSAFLDSLQQGDILRQELTRLTEAARDGGLARKSLIELEYELKRLLAQKEIRRQELMIRGLTAEQLEEIVNSRELIREVTIFAPQNLSRPQHHAHDPSDPWAITIEELLVTPGLYVRQGTPLCNIAHHAALYLEGLAFERDLPAIVALFDQQLPVTAELGDDNNPITLSGLRIVHLDNHVDTTGQAYRFYLELQNEVLRENLRSDDRRFRTWKFKPGQRGHVFLPQQTFEKVFVVPIEALARDGLEYVVFRRERHRSGHQHAGGGADHNHQHGDLFEPVKVHVLHRDRRSAVLATSGELRSGNIIVANAAYQLLLASKTGSGDSHHGHDH